MNLSAFFSEIQQGHAPDHFMRSGVVGESPEGPGRADVLREALERMQVRVQQPRDYGLAPLQAVHSNEYIDFLASIYQRWPHDPSGKGKVLPNVHPPHRDGIYPQSPVGQAGYHFLDLSCPVSDKTWQAVRYSAYAAVAAADAVIEGQGVSYALSRPPGHHAFRDFGSGFCFLNNAAIAAERLREHYPRIALLDVDVHHGNGTQDIFYRRGDVLTVSIHTDPLNFYPFYWGSPQERGDGEGRGCNLNIALPQGSNEAVYFAALGNALSRISLFAPDALVVSLGLDAYEGDPFAGMTITTPGFAEIGKRIAQLNLPTVLVQEGGYCCADLGVNLEQFISGFIKHHNRSNA